MEFLSLLAISSTTLLTLIVLGVACLLVSYMVYYFITTIHKAHEQPHAHLDHKT